MSGNKLVVNLDIASIYSYFLFEELKGLLPQLAAHGVEVDIVPFFLGGVMNGSKNNPPWFNKAKGAWLAKDTQRSAARLGISFNFPKGFIARANDLVPLRALTYIKRNFSPTVYMSAFNTLFIAFWTPPNADLNDVEVLKKTLLSVEGIGEHEAARVAAAISDEEIKKEVQKVTNTAVAQGAFGAPRIVAKKADGKEATFFGSDRLHHIYLFLDLQFTDVKLGSAAAKL